jgi:pimeloyl-ACP methyl ester carboxylesterase
MQGERLNDGLSVATAGTGPDLVFLPGLGQSADLSREVPRNMARSVRAVATGSRRTVHMICRPIDMPSGTTIAQLAGWHAVALRERFGRPVDVLGTSGGGATALQLALDHPDVVRRLVVYIAASRVSDRGRRELLRSVEFERQGTSSAWLSSGLVAHGLLRVVVAATYALGRNTRQGQDDVALIEAAQDWDVTERLGEIGVPTLVVGGTRDPIIPPELAEATARGIPNGRLLLLRGRGHATALFDPRGMQATRTLLHDHGSGIRLSSSGVDHRSQNGDRCCLLGAQMLEHDPTGASWRSALDDFIGCHDQVDAEVMLGFGQRSVDDLELVDRRHNHGSGADQSGLGQQGHFDV